MGVNPGRLLTDKEHSMSQNDAKKGQEQQVNTSNGQHQAANLSLARECSDRGPREDRLRAIHDMLASDQYDPPALLVAEQMINRALASKDTQPK